MTTENKNRPAFATSSPSCDRQREYFAGLAMQGLLANGMTSQEGVKPPYLMSFKELAELSIGYADELLKQLEEL